MKSNERRFQVIVWGLCIVLAIALIILVYSDKKKNQERIIQAQIQNNDANTTVEGESEYEKKALSIYEDLVSELQLNSFVCWGDNEMAGNANSSLPKKIGEVSDNEVLELLSKSFSKTVEKEKRDIPSTAVINMGVANEGMSEILVRSGVDGLEVGEWVLIPGEKEPINIVLRNSESGTTLHFAQQEEAKFGQVEISGVKGTLTKGDGEYDEDHPKLAFVRDRAGDNLQVGLGTEVEIESATEFIGCIPIFFFEDDTIDTVNSVGEFMSDIERLVQRYTVIEEEGSESFEELPYVVICTVDEESELDESLEEAFGDHYIRHDTYADDMTDDGYIELAQKVYANLDGQGCFDEMKEKIEKAAEEIKVAD